MNKQFKTICKIHDEIMNLADDIEYMAKNASSVDDVQDVENLAAKIYSLADQAKDCGERMENRLRDYKDVIESLGFKRVKPEQK